jgi:hypothetical protein
VPLIPLLEDLLQYYPPINAKVSKHVSFPSLFPTITLCAHFHSIIPDTCPHRLIHLDLITPRIFGEEYRSLSSSLYSLLHSPVTLGPNTFLSILFPDTISTFSSMCKTLFRTHTNQQTELQFCIPLIFICLGSNLEVRRFCID